jgi:hypothetical protein
MPVQLTAESVQKEDRKPETNEVVNGVVAVRRTAHLARFSAS